MTTYNSTKGLLGGLNKRLIDAPERNIRKALTKSAMLVDTAAKMSILRGSKSGDTVTKYNPNRSHLQSAAGEAPASDTGFLANSISHEVVTNNKGSYKEYVGIVSASADYAIHLEFGTVNMEARPFLRPALLDNRQKIEAIFKRQGIIT